MFARRCLDHTQSGKGRGMELTLKLSCIHILAATEFSIQQRMTSRSTSLEACFSSSIALLQRHTASTQHISMLSHNGVDSGLMTTCSRLATSPQDVHIPCDTGCAHSL